jgi:hypothetical protein
MMICDKCNAGITAGSRFCAQCGDPVSEADRVINIVQDSSIASVEIIFGESSSPNFRKAVDICKNIPTYSVTGEGKQTQYRIKLPITEVELLINVYDLVGSWKTSQMLINGLSASKKNLTYYGVGCYRNRQKAFKPEQHCFGEKDFEFNIWGCKKLNLPIYGWGGGWLDYGQFDKSGVWHFDKARIKHALEVSIKENEHCPVLNKQRIFETLERLPEAIDPKTDKNWSYVTTYEEIKGEYKEVATGIKPNIKNVNKYVIGEYNPHWDFQESEHNSATVDIVVNAESKEDNSILKKIKGFWKK